jgi:hypothetical protein
MGVGMSQLEAFVEKITQLRESEEKRAYTREELKTIALGMGLSEEDWAEIQETASDHGIRGRGFLKYGNWGDAIRELGQAAILVPGDSDLYLNLGRAHAGRFRAEGNAEDRDQAIRWAEACLNLDPDREEAIRLVSELKAGRRSSAGEKPKADRGKPPSRALILAVMTSILILMGLGLSFWAYLTPATIKTPALDQTASVPARLEPAPSASNQPEAIVFSSGLGVPVRIVGNEKTSGWNWEVDSSTFTPYVGAWSYNLRMYARPVGYEIRQAALKIELISRTGDVVTAGREEFHGDYQPVVRNQDVIPIDYLQHEKTDLMPDLAEVVLSMETLSRHPAPPGYEPCPIVETAWPDRPDHMKIEVRRRSLTVAQGYMFDQTKLRHDLVLELKNTGATPLELVKFGVAYFDRAGKLRHKVESLAVIETQPVFRPGQVWGARVLTGLPDMKAEEYGRYEVSVIEAR